MAKGRRPQDPNKVPFQDILPLRLRDRVSGKLDRDSELACISEMQTLFTCLKQHDFQQSQCLTEANIFRKCYETFMTVQREKQVAERSGVLIPGAKTISSTLLNKYLKKFPIPK